MTRTSGSVPDGRTSTRPRPSSARALALDRLPQRRSRRRAPRGRRPRRSRARCGRRSNGLAVGEVAAAERAQRQQRRGDAVAGGREVGPDDVARLLAAERPARARSSADDVAVADRGWSRPRSRPPPSPGGSRSWSSPSPRRRRRAGPASRRWRAASAISSSPSRTRPSRVDGDHPVAVAVEGEADLGARRRAPARRARSGWVEPQPSLMLRPSGSSPIASTSAPRRSKIAGAAR